MRSADYPEKTMDQVHRLFKSRERVNPAFRTKMTDLRGSIEDYGIANPVFLNAEEGEVGNGHHRFSAAKSLRMKEIPVTNDMRRSI